MDRIFVFLITLLAGVGCAKAVVGLNKVFSGNEVSVGKNAIQKLACDPNDQAPYVLSVSVNETLEMAGGGAVEVIVSNEGCNSVSYFGYEDYPIYMIRANSIPKDQFWCGTGIEKFVLKPGGSIKLTIPIVWVNDGKRNDKRHYSIGFEFSARGNSYEVWSPDFSVTGGTFEPRHLRKLKTEIRVER